MIRGRSLRKDIPEITALRILAALCVVISHLHALGMVCAARFDEIVDGGRPAVCFFFVLSGFIMHHNYPLLDARDSVATRRFARSRVARLYPTLLLSLCMALPTVIYLLTTHADDLLLQYYALKSHYASWLVASAIAQLLVLTGWTPAAAINQPWNGPAWSLSCEFFFYAAFPFIRPVLQRLSSRLIIVAMIAAWLLQGIWMIALYAFAAPNRSPFLVYQFPLTHFPEFMAGICVGILFSRFNRQQLNVLIGVATVAALLAVAAVYSWQQSGLQVHCGWRRCAIAWWLRSGMPATRFILSMCRFCSARRCSESRSLLAGSGCRYCCLPAFSYTIGMRNLFVAGC